jgi:hypothetical protein
MKRPASLLIIFLAAVYSLVIATGLLTLILLTAAALSGRSLGDFYAAAFPTFRGHGPTDDIPLLAYPLFVSYVVFTASVAVSCRRRIAERWRR